LATKNGNTKLRVAIILLLLFMKKNKFLRIFKWAALNLFLAWCAWEGAINGNAGARNVLYFAAWFFAITYFLAGTIVSKEEIEKITEKGRSVPAIVSHGFDSFMILFLVWHSWWVTAIAFLISTIFKAELFQKNNKKEEIEK
jgi:hypothetical protein